MSSDNTQLLLRLQTHLELLQKLQVQIKIDGDTNTLETWSNSVIARLTGIKTMTKRLELNEFHVNRGSAIIKFPASIQKTGLTVKDLYDTLAYLVQISAPTHGSYWAVVIKITLDGPLLGEVQPVSYSKIYFENTWKYRTPPAGNFFPHLEALAAQGDSAGLD